jgi:carboxyl-terminal processing protease
MEEHSQETRHLELAKNKKLFRGYLMFFGVIFLIIFSYYLGRSRALNQAAQLENQTFPLTSTCLNNKTVNSDKAIDFSLFWKVWDLLKNKYVNKDSLDAQKLVYGAINGMLKATGDPYSTFFDPTETKAFNQDMEGSFEGIGAELGMKDNVLTVIAPLESSPAEKAGLMAGDKILKIGEKSTMDMSIDDAVDLIRGKKGTTIELTVFHKGEESSRKITITRDTIIVKSVKLEMKSDGIAYIKINKFSEDTDSEFNAIIPEIINKRAKGIVLDLRNNPGGFLDRTVAVASRMIPAGKVVVMEEDSSGKRESLYTKGGDKLSAIPTVVLVDEGSASASEILAGALRDNQGIQLIGKKSFGKGSVQELIDLPNGTSVKITVAKWLTPKGDYIMEKGITPDTEVELSLDDYKNDRDPQFDKAMEVLREKIK